MVISEEVVAKCGHESSPDSPKSPASENDAESVRGGDGSGKGKETEDEFSERGDSEGEETPGISVGGGESELKQLQVTIRQIQAQQV